MIPRLALLLILTTTAAAQPAAPAMPISGTPDPRFARFDDEIRKFMTQRSISAGVLAIRWKGQPVYQRGFGWRDDARQRPLPAGTRFRLGPLSAVLTSAAVQKLIADGKLRLDEPVLAKLGVQPTVEPPDPRFDRITVARLLAHQPGWDFTETFDPLDDPWKVAEALKIEQHPTPDDFIRYLASQKLANEPGEKTYPTRIDAIVLGRLVETVSAKPLAEYVRQAVLSPLQIRDIEPAGLLAGDRRRDEIGYQHAATSRPVIDAAKPAPDASEVPGAYGGVHLTHRRAADGWLGSAASFATVMDSHGPDGSAPEGHLNATLHGALPGSYAVAIWRSDSMRIVLLLNQCQDASGEPYDVIAKALQSAADAARRELR
jgi:CubicO group peptidase (beta-lactamase class C family)